MVLGSLFDGIGMAQPCADYVIRRIVEVTSNAKSKS